MIKLIITYKKRKIRMLKHSIVYTEQLVNELGMKLIIIVEEKL